MIKSKTSEQEQEQEQEIKTTKPEKLPTFSFRLEPDAVQNFREIANQNGVKHHEMFTGLINNFKMSKAKDNIPDRAKEIEIFQSTMNKAINMFMNSLEINQNAEERIRDSLALELNTKDKTISDLQEFKENAKITLKQNKELLADITDLNKDLEEKIAKLETELAEKNNIIINMQQQVNTLNTLVAEYTEFKTENKKLATQNNVLEDQIKNLQHEKIDLQSKLENAEKLQNFFAKQSEELNIEIKKLNKEIKDEIKEIEAAHKQEIKLLETAYKKEYKQTLKELETQHKANIIELNEFNKEEINAIKKELTSNFKAELAEKLEAEKQKYIDLELKLIEKKK